MSKRKIGVCSVAALATAALVMPAPGQAQSDGIDLAETCDALIGSDSYQINLGPIARITLWTCKEADLDGE